MNYTRHFALQAIFLVALFLTTNANKAEKNRRYRMIVQHNNHLNAERASELKRNLTGDLSIDKLCALGRTIPFLLPHEFLKAERCLYCLDSEDPTLSKRNLPCCGSILCIPCLRTEYAAHKVRDLKQNHFKCRVCRKKLFNYNRRHPSQRDRIKRRIYKAVTRKKAFAKALAEEEPKRVANLAIEAAENEAAARALAEEMQQEYDAELAAQLAAESSDDDDDV